MTKEKNVNFILLECTTGPVILNKLAIAAVLFFDEKSLEVWLVSGNTIIVNSDFSELLEKLNF